MKRVRATIGVVFAAAIVVGGSGWPEGSAADDACKDAVTQGQINECMAASLRKSEAALAQKYEKLKAAMPPESRQAFEDAREAWLRYRKLECSANASVYEGGSMAPGQYYGCEAWLTDERIREIDRMLNELAH